MRVYMAAFYQTGKVRTQSVSVHQRITTSNFVYPWILESYHYMDKLMVKSIRQHQRTIFLDSGAFSAFTLGVKLDLKEYAGFLQDHRDLFHVASNIDVIGRDKEAETYANQKALENLLGPGVVMPVHHVRDHDDWLRRYLDEGYDYIFIGGMVPEEVPVLKQWLDHVWTKYLTNPDGTAKLKVHGFGLTVEELMFRYPWYSIDSTSWVIASGFGFVFVDLPRPDGSVTCIKVNFSEHSSQRYGIDSWHFWSLNKDDQELIRRRLAEAEALRAWKADPILEKDFKKRLGTELAYTPEAFSKSYGLRRVACMDYYLRATDRRIHSFAHAQETLF